MYSVCLKVDSSGWCDEALMAWNALKVQLFYVCLGMQCGSIHGSTGGFDGRCPAFVFILDEPGHVCDLDVLSGFDATFF